MDLTGSMFLLLPQCAHQQVYGDSLPPAGQTEHVHIVKAELRALTSSLIYSSSSPSSSCEMSCCHSLMILTSLPGPRITLQARFSHMSLLPEETLTFPHTEAQSTWISTRLLLPLLHHPYYYWLEFLFQKLWGTHSHSSHIWNHSQSLASDIWEPATMLIADEWSHSFINSFIAIIFTTQTFSFHRHQLS